NLENDPGEKINLAEQQPERVEELSSLLTKWYVPQNRKPGAYRSSTPTRTPVKKRSKPQINSRPGNQ
ncbi:MAG: hypothetical protein VX694_01980, partial [Planctomycetota bacterium]|nr:hypothetical protein [Planctomycetota bacterium]